MNDNGKCALKIKQTLIIFIALVVGAISSQFTNTIVQGAQITSEDIQESQTEESEIEEETKVADMIERNIKISSRSDTERIQNIEAAKAVMRYKTIDEVTISRDMDLTESCGLSREDFIELMTGLKVDTSGFFERNAGIIYDLCKEYELNEIFFCGLIAGESGWNIASGHRSTHNYISMMSGGHLIQYASDEDGLEAAAKLLHNRYLSEGGSYYRGKTLSSVQKVFCPNSSTWVGLIYTCMSQIV